VKLLAAELRATNLLTNHSSILPNFSEPNASGTQMLLTGNIRDGSEPSQNFEGATFARMNTQRSRNGSGFFTFIRLFRASHRTSHRTIRDSRTASETIRPIGEAVAIDGIVWRQNFVAMPMTGNDDGQR
jgi:hypothetical protein